MTDERRPLGAPVAPSPTDAADSVQALVRDVRGLVAFQGELGLSGLDLEAGWLSREPRAGAAPALAAAAPSPPQVAAAPMRPAAAVAVRAEAAGDRGGALLAIRDDIGDCKRCKLCQKRTHIVFGVGNPAARLMFIGEGPGRDEDLQGEPFVGAAGQLLDKMINAMGLSRRDVYIANVVKCRPPQNRDPEPDEVEACEPFLKRQIAVIGPEVIVALGRHAAQTLLRDPTSITRLRGQWRSYEGIPLMPTFHPAYLLRNAEGKKPVWQDLQAVLHKLGMSAPTRPARGGPTGEESSGP